MATSFLPYEPNQTFLLPPSPSEWLAEDHLVYFVSEIIDRFKSGKFFAAKNQILKLAVTMGRCWSRCWCTGMRRESSLRASWRESFTRM